jgi:hypothetical protein
MAAPKGILALIAGKSKGSGGSLPGESSGSGSSPLDEKAAALKSMWGNMKSGDFDAAALDFQDAYDACAEAEEEESADDSADYALGDGEEDEMEE